MKTSKRNDHSQLMFLPEYRVRIASLAPEIFQPDCCVQVPYNVRGGPVEPATVAKVVAPFNGRNCGWFSSGTPGHTWTTGQFLKHLSDFKKMDRSNSVPAEEEEEFIWNRTRVSQF